MRHTTGEKMVKGLQKEFLFWVEENPIFDDIDAVAFNIIRKRVFRTTFEAFRLGVVGIETLDSNEPLWKQFFGWLTDKEDGVSVDVTSEIKLALAEKGFRTTLQAFRIGSMVAAGK